MSNALSHVTVLDLSRILAGPWAGQVLADLGADVIRARAMQVEMPHPTSGSVSLVANPLRLSATPVTYRTAPPTLGEQTRDVLTERLGMSTEEIDRLTATGII